MALIPSLLAMDWDLRRLLKKSAELSDLHNPQPQINVCICLVSIRQIHTVLTHTSGFLIIVDSLTILAAWSTDQETRFNLTEYLSFLIASQVQTTQAQTSLVAVLHTDVPVSNASTPYSPRPLALLSYLATSIITVHSLPNLLATREARARSSAEPVFGLEEEIEGVVIGVNPWAKCPRRDEEGVVLELEHRRKSGRGVLEWYFMPRTSRPRPIAAHPFKERVILLDDHPLYRLKPNEETADPELASLTFDIGLTQRQREQREGVVLPYFDAQKAEGGGEGGRILYDMGVEDDFDEEEDEM